MTTPVNGQCRRSWTQSLMLLYFLCVSVTLYLAIFLDNIPFWNKVLGMYYWAICQIHGHEIASVHHLNFLPKVYKDFQTNFVNLNFSSCEVSTNFHHHFASPSYNFSLKCSCLLVNLVFETAAFILCTTFCVKSYQMLINGNKVCYLRWLIVL